MDISLQKRVKNYLILVEIVLKLYIVIKYGGINYGNI